MTKVTSYQTKPAAIPVGENFASPKSHDESYQALQELLDDYSPSTKCTPGGEEGIHYRRLVFPYEEHFLRLIQSCHGPFMDAFAIFCAYLIWPDLSLMITFFLMLADPVNMLPFGLFFGFQELFNGLIKWMVQNPRPYYVYENVRLLETTIDEGSSFPSSHAQCFAFLAIALTLIYGWNVWTMLLVPVAILGGLTRVYIGVHFFHDVVIGWIFASLWAFGFYHADAMNWWFGLDEDSRLIYIVIFALCVPASFYLVKILFPSPSTIVIERMLHVARHNHPTGKIIKYRSRQFHSYLYQYAITLGVLIGFEINIRNNNLDYYRQSFGDIIHIYPRIVIGLVIPIMLVVSFEVLKESSALRQLYQGFRLIILSIPMILIGIYEAYTVPAWSTHRHWLNDR